MGLRGATISSFFLDFREILEIGEIQRGATSPAALARGEEVAKRLPSPRRSEKKKMKVKNKSFSKFAENLWSGS